MLSTCEETLRQAFSRFKPGSVERVKKLTDYAFVHYRCRDDAVAALGLMKGAQIDGATVEVTLAKPAGVKDGGGVAGGRRYNNNNHRGYAGGGEGGEGGGDSGAFFLHRSDGGAERTSSPRSPFYSGRRSLTINNDQLTTK